MAHSPTHLVRQLINKLVEIRRTSPGTKTVLHASFDDTFMGKSTTLEKINYMERIEAHIYSEVSLPIQKM